MSQSDRFHKFCQVLNAFKKLHRTRMNVFKSDERALIAGREEINANFRKNQREEDETEIKKVFIRQRINVYQKVNTFEPIADDSIGLGCGKGVAHQYHTGGRKV